MLRGVLERMQIALHKVGAQEQIPRWIAAEEQLRSHDKLSPELAGLLISRDQLLDRAGEITDRRVKLQQTELHAAV